MVGETPSGGTMVGSVGAAAIVPVVGGMAGMVCVVAVACVGWACSAGGWAVMGGGAMIGLVGAAGIVPVVAAPGKMIELMGKGRSGKVMEGTMCSLVAKGLLGIVYTRARQVQVVAVGSWRIGPCGGAGKRAGGGRPNKVGPRGGAGAVDDVFGTKLPTATCMGRSGVKRRCMMLTASQA